MKNFIVATAVILAAFVAISQIDVTQAQNNFGQYKAFVKKFGKILPTGSELFYRAKIYQQSVMQMIKHNADKTKTWKMGINQFSDITNQQFISTYLGQLNSKVNSNFVQEPVNAGFLGQIDWRQRNIITSIKNQGACGSCWTFAATAAHESYQVQFKGQPLSIALSEQQIVDCATESPYQGGGCNGGYAVRALQYIKDHGQTTDASYPYMAVNQECRVASGNYRIFGVAQTTGCSNIEQVIQQRPMAVRVDATNWKKYSSGIFDDCEKNINHAVFLVGSTLESWIIKNSWDTTWGENGYIRLAKNDTCAVCQGPSFPI